MLSSGKITTKIDPDHRSLIFCNTENDRRLIMEGSFLPNWTSIETHWNTAAWWVVLDIVLRGLGNWSILLDVWELPQCSRHNNYSAVQIFLCEFAWIPPSGYLWPLVGVSRNILERNMHFRACLTTKHMEEEEEEEEEEGTDDWTLLNWCLTVSPYSSCV